MKPYISVVIPLFNKEKSILRAIDSVLNQSEQNFELIVVNDGSTDQSALLVSTRSHDKRIRLINQENAGVSTARNRGIVETRSELIAFLDADDEWHRDFLRTIIDLQTQFPDGGVFGTLYYVKIKDGEQLLPNIAPFFKTDFIGYIENYLNVLRIALPFNSSSFAVDRKVIQAVGGFPVGIKFGEDVDTWIRLSLSTKVVYANKPLAIYHREAENRSSDIFYSPLGEYYPVYNLAQMIMNGHVPIHLRQSAIEYIAKYRLSLANSYLSKGNPRVARDLLISCFGTKIYYKKWLLLYCCSFIPPIILKTLIRIKRIFIEGINGLQRNHSSLQ